MFAFDYINISRYFLLRQLKKLEADFLSLNANSYSLEFSYKQFKNMLFPIGSLVSLIACGEVVTALYSSGSNLALRDLDSRDRITTLGAIALSSVEQKRSLSNLKPALECDHHYADRKSPIFYMIEEFGRWNGSNVSLRER